jgi:hypothetical protein
MINRQNPSERAQLKKGSDALDSARLATPAIADFYNDIDPKQTFALRYCVTKFHRTNSSAER